MKFKHYIHADYQAVCDFLIALNHQDKTHINWNWARWEWMYAHPYFDRTQVHTIGLWKDNGIVVAAAIYDLYHGEAFCAALEDYGELFPEISEYTYRNLKDDKGLGIAVHDGDSKMQERMLNLGYHKAEQTETILYRDLEQDLDYQLPDGFKIREIHFPEDNLAYQTVIWKGFDHEGDAAELEKMLQNKELPPNRRPELCLAAANETGEFVAHCTCWYDARTDYAYVEPVCTIPNYRGKGLGKAVVCEALNRCKKLGAQKAFVISELEFYQKLGFMNHSHYTFYWHK
ncbi:MAG: GNAT family N-acetyltransferase [Eubacteriales bacterium]|nr:GNAT family N-acetyltransferase [Eubacteriales bacterium]MDD4323545.1 GNAT family N-acetyltransferase [Eubacteriales bacterium]MDD4541410.1 GNAT family N-acetyltransferase [Eubacteriales bacterium]